MNRKQFVKLGALGWFAKPDWPEVQAPVNPKKIVVATWDSGLPVAKEAYQSLQQGASAVDAVEKGGRLIEDQLNCCVGLGGYPDRDGIVTLDACIMDHLSNCGAVAGLERIKHPVSVARQVMEKTPHVLLVGQGAQQFALQNGFTLESPALSPDAEQAWKKWLEKHDYKPVINIENKKNNGPFAPAFFDDGSPNHDTMGLLAMDQQGHLAGAVTTSGMAFKIHGRVGDSPVIGAGLFVDAEAGAATSSGVGEEVIRICGTHLVVEFMRQGKKPEEACKLAVERIIKRDPKKARTLQVGFLALDRQGNYGAYSIQKGFTYSVKQENEEIVRTSPYFFELY